MKRNKNKYGYKALLQWSILVLVVGFFSNVQAAIVVNMEVNEGETELNITTHGTCSGTNVPRGCMKVTGKNQQINFNLIGNRGCSATPGTNWKLESVVLSEEKGQVGISQVASDDFGADMETGNITNPVSQNDHHMGVRDNNTEAYDVWYTVYAQCGGVKISTDPRIKNDGTGQD